LRLRLAPCVATATSRWPIALGHESCDVALVQVLIASPLLLLIVVYVGSLAISEIGFRIGRPLRAHTDEPARGLEGAVQAAALGLLALLLGFSFSLVASRYDSRREVIVREANAIGTAYLRAQLLPEPQRSESREILRRYVAERIRAYDLGTEAAKSAAIRSKELQDALWSRAMTTAGDERVAPVFTATVVQSLNEVIDSSEEAVTAFENEIPRSIMRLLLAIAAVVAGIAGYCDGVSGRRLLLVFAVQPLLVALVIATITDMNQPFRGRVRVSQNALVRAEASMQ
jgi:hypothetical protein